MAIKTWVWVVGGFAVLAIVAFLTFIGLGVYVALNNVHVTTATAASAEDEFVVARARFKDRAPLLIVDEKGNMRSSAQPEVGTTPLQQPPQLSSLHLMAWDPNDGKLVRVKVPFWVLRLTHPGAQLKFGTDEIDLERLKVTIEDLERHGPGLILDHREPAGSHVLLWAE